MLLPNDFWDKVDEFGLVLKQFNKIHSLTNYNDIKPAVEDSIKPLEFLDISPKTVCDVGSGAGFPALFLSLILQTSEFHLYEPIAKKSSFLTYVKMKLGLKNITVHPKKLEDSTKFIADLITSRALMKTQFLLKICNGFYDENTKFLLYKGSLAKDEINDLECQKDIIKNGAHRNYIFLKGIKC
ncbi:methyltransferase GidB [Campylobacter hyointestinalis subsp. hyointestinalis]|uniref:Ribosomal RNA small subunit methyltransferase G n=1 Tax=Campylobacter hyointestinalis subsp. hyointestinalis TaxID=91352 RepID=A0A9W5AV05_CAMHY|nr:16S rRNA (guanine(527)-N(7))-methyltransferase RsmG [Campylobacter hyointestinalis]CUU85153.1 methyltransferase GidB [Campylobacter hyointestinalis subsp. hyointestinalis]